MDVGCGAGRDTQWLGELGYDAVAIDLSSGMLTEGRRRVPNGRFVQATVTRLPIDSASMDGAWICSSLVHLNHDEVSVALGEIARVLRPGGAIYVGVEEGGGAEWRVESNGSRRRYHFWQGSELAELVTSSGFTVVEQYVDHVPPWRFLTTLGTREV
jgi:ubiquinone/menaquinone biosynthesis C-methylase UbiE